MTEFCERHALRCLGAGIGLRRSFFDDIPATERRVDWLEVTPENFIGAGGWYERALQRSDERWQLLPHGVAMDIGGPDPLDERYLDGLGALVDRLDAPFFSDHICYSRLNGVQLHDLLPLPFNEAVIEHMVPRIEAVQRRIGRPFLLENPTWYERMPRSTMSEAEFICGLVEAADCGLLLDVNNMVVNARNHGFDPLAQLDAMPLERVAQVHLAGHTPRDGVVIDTHIGPVPAEVWALYDALLERIGPVTTLIEWDQEIPSLDAVLDEADRARKKLEATTVAPV